VGKWKALVEKKKECKNGYGGKKLTAPLGRGESLKKEKKGKHKKLTQKWHLKRGRKESPRSPSTWGRVLASGELLSGSKRFLAGGGTENETASKNHQRDREATKRQGTK